MSRAVETAEIIAPSLTTERDARWRELDFGAWEGAEVSRTDARAYAPEGGETYDALRGRVRDALTDLRARDAGRVLVVTHAGPLHAVLDVLLGARHPRFGFGTYTHVRLEEDGARLLEIDASPAGE